MTDHTMADGCCSSRKPCGYQCKDPTTICDTCRAASPSVSAWLEAQEKKARAEVAKLDPSSLEAATWRAIASAYEAAHAYAVVRPDRAPVTKLVTSRNPVTDADLAYLAGLAISTKDATLARIAAALLLAR